MKIIWKSKFCWILQQRLQKIFPAQSTTPTPNDTMHWWPWRHSHGHSCVQKRPLPSALTHLYTLKAFHGLKHSHNINKWTNLTNLLSKIMIWFHCPLDWRISVLSYWICCGATCNSILVAELGWKMRIFFWVFFCCKIQMDWKVSCTVFFKWNTMPNIAKTLQ